RVAETTRCAERFRERRGARSYRELVPADVEQDPSAQPRKESPPAFFGAGDDVASTQAREDLLRPGRRRRRLRHVSRREARRGPRKPAIDLLVPGIDLAHCPPHLPQHPGVNLAWSAAGDDRG